MVFRHRAALIALSVSALIAGCSSGSSEPKDQTGEVSGQVLFGAISVDGAQIEFFGDGGTFLTVTNGSGGYTLPDVPVGTYTARIDATATSSREGQQLPELVAPDYTAVVVTESGATIDNGVIQLFERGVSIPTVATSALGGGAQTVRTIPAGTIGIGGQIHLLATQDTTVTFSDPTQTELTITEVTPRADQGQVVRFLVQPTDAIISPAPTLKFVGSAQGSPHILVAHTALAKGYQHLVAKSNAALGGHQVIGQFEGFRRSSWNMLTTAAIAGGGEYTLRRADNEPCEILLTGHVQDRHGVAASSAQLSGPISAATDVNGDFAVMVPRNYSPYGAFLTCTLSREPYLDGLGRRITTNTTPAFIQVAGCPSTPGMSHFIVDTAVDPNGSTPFTLDDVTSGAASGPISTNSVFTLETSLPISSRSMPYALYVVPRSDLPTSVSSITISDLFGSGIPVEYSVDIRSDSATIQIIPTDGLEPDETYAICALNLLSDDYGQKLTSKQSLGTVFDLFTGARLEHFSTATTDSVPTAGPATVSVTPQGPTNVSVHQTLMLEAEAEFATSGEPVPNAHFNWSSSDETVAKVSTTGIVRAMGTGTATITAAFGTLTATADITAVAPVPDSIVLNQVAETMLVDSTALVGVTVQDSSAHRILGPGLMFSSNNESVASVDFFGRVTANGAGVATITAQVTGTALTADVAVSVLSASSIASVELSSDDLLIVSDGGQILTATAIAGMNSPVPGVPLAWTSADESIARVTNGLVSGVGAGSTTIMASVDLDGVSAMATADVEVLSSDQLTVLVFGGSDGQTPEAGVRVLRYDTSNSQLVDDQTTGDQGIVTFGAIEAGTTTIAVVRDLTGQSIPRVDVQVFENVPPRSLTVGFEPAQGQEIFNVELTGVPAGSTVGTVAAGGRRAGSTFASGGSSPSITVFDVATEERQSNGLVSLLAASSDPTNGQGTAAGFLFDLDPADLDGVQQSLALDPLKIVGTAFMTDAPIARLGSRTFRNGSSFDLMFENQGQLASGMATAPKVDSANESTYIFESGSAPTTRRRHSKRLLDSVESYDFDMPNVDVGSVTYDSQTESFGWTSSGVDLDTIDYVEARAAYPDSSGNTISWKFFTAPTTSGVTLPTLPLDLAAYGVPFSAPDFEVELFEVDTLDGIEGISTALNQSVGNLDWYRGWNSQSSFSAWNELTINAPTTFNLSVEISGSGTGTVTVDVGQGAVTVSDGDVITLDSGTLVDAVVSADTGFVITLISCPDGPGLGEGTDSGSCTFNLTFDGALEVMFD